MSQDLNDEQLSKMYANNLSQLEVDKFYEFENVPGWETTTYTRKSAEDTKKLFELATNLAKEKTTNCLVCMNTCRIHATWEHEYRNKYSLNYVCEKCNFDISVYANYSGPWD